MHVNQRDATPPSMTSGSRAIQNFEKITPLHMIYVVSDVSNRILSDGLEESIVSWVKVFWKEPKLIRHLLQPNSTAVEEGTLKSVHKHEIVEVGSYER